MKSRRNKEKIMKFAGIMGESEGREVETIAKRLRKNVRLFLKQYN